MKKLISILMLAVAVVTAHAQGVNVLGKIVPNSVIDTYPTHVDSLGRGGFVAVATWQERNSIPTPRRKAGMMVSVKSAAVDSLYRLGVGLTNAHWVPYAPSVDVSGKANLSGGNSFSGAQVVDGEDGLFVTYAEGGNRSSSLIAGNLSLYGGTGGGEAQLNPNQLSMTGSVGRALVDLSSGNPSISLIKTPSGGGHSTTIELDNTLSTSNTLKLPTVNGTLALTSDIADKASISGDNEFFGQNTFYNPVQLTDVYNYGTYYADNGFQGPAMIFYTAPISSYSIVMDYDYDNPPTKDESIKVPSKSGTLALTSDIPKILTISSTGDGTTSVFSSPHGLSYTPTFITATPNTLDAAEGVRPTTGTVGARSYYLTADATNVYLRLSADSIPASGANLKWTLMIK